MGSSNWTPKRTAAGRMRLVNNKGEELYDETDSPVEFDPPPARVEGNGLARDGAPDSELVRLKAENDRLRAAAGQQAQGSRDDGGLDRESLRKLLASSAHGRQVLGRLDRGELSWDEIDMEAGRLQEAGF